MATQHAPCAQNAIAALTEGAAIIRTTCNSPRVTDVLIALQPERTKRGGALSQCLSSLSGSPNYEMTSNRNSPLCGPNTEEGQSASPSLAVRESPKDSDGGAAQLRPAEHRTPAAVASERGPRQEMIAAAAEAYQSAPTLTQMSGAVAGKRRPDAPRAERSPKVSEIASCSATVPPGQRVSLAGRRGRFIEISVTAPLNRPFTESHQAKAASLPRDKAAA